MPQYALRSFYILLFGKNYSPMGVKQEVICVAEACLFGFHVSMATGTYSTSRVLSVHKVLTMYYYYIPRTFLQSKEPRVQRLM